MPAPDYQLAYLDAALSSGESEAWTRWQAVFQRAYQQWDLERADQLLRLARSQVLSRQQQGLVCYLTGRLRLRQDRLADAHRAYEQALVAAHDAGEPRDALMALTVLANLLRRSGRPTDEILATYQQALELATTLGDEVDHAHVLNGIGLLHYNQGVFDQARSCYEEALISARAVANAPLAAALLHNLGSLAWTQGRLEEAATLFTESLATQPVGSNEHGRAETLNSLGLVEEARGDWKAATDLYRRSLEAMQAAGDLYGQTQALTNLGNVEWLLGDPVQSLAHHQQARALAQDLGDDRLAGQALGGIGDSYRTFGRFEEAEAAFQQAIALKKAAGEERSLKHTYLSLGALYQVQQRAHEAQTAYETALGLAREQQDPRMEATTLLNLGQLALAQEQLDLARQHLDAAEAVASQGPYWDCLAAVARSQGDVEFLQPEPRMQRLLVSYLAACFYAAQFNETLLRDTLDYLRRLWRAHAEDGYMDQACMFCTGALAAWGQLNTGTDDSSVPDFFARLQAELSCLSDYQGGDEHAARPAGSSGADN